MPTVKLTQRNLLRIGDENLIFEHGKMLLSETIAVEKATGLSWPQVIVGLQNGVTQAVRAVVWVLRKRHNNRLRLDEVDFSMEDYQLLDPDFEPDYWVVTNDDDPEGVLVPDSWPGGGLPAEDVADDNEEIQDTPAAPKADPEQGA
jgi:hypothetical protein